MSAVEYLIRDYLWDVYAINDQGIYELIRRHLPMRQVELLRHVTLRTRKTALMITAKPHSLKRVIVMSENGKDRRVFRAE